MTAVVRDVFDDLFAEAERVRWKLGAVPWHLVQRDQASPELVQLVRQIAASEATTFSASQRFLQDFADDIELTNWIAVWFYEETKHPYVMLRWLAAVGDEHDPNLMRRARVTTPFMKSRMATLTSNIISEIVASSRYMNLSERSPEPVLSQIAQHLAGDEARHAASFFTFARKRLAESRQPDADRRDAMKVLYLWLGSNSQIHHPVNLFRTTQASAAAISAVQSRVLRTIGLLVGAPLGTTDDVMAWLKGENYGTS